MRKPDRSEPRKVRRMAGRGRARRGQGGGHYWQAAPRPDRHGRIAVRRRSYPLRQSRCRAPAELLALACFPRFTAAAPPVIRRHGTAQNRCPRPPDQSRDPETGGTLTIDLDAVEANWRALTRKLLTVECAAVVKANAYGLGLEPVTAKLAKAGCKTFFVADIAEARRARARARDAADLRAQWIFARGRDGLRRTQCAAGHQQHHGTGRVGRFRRCESGWRGGAAMHVDTGMNRLGISADGSRRAGASPAAREPRHHAIDEPPRLRRDSGSSAQRQPDPAVSRAAPALSRRSRVARQFLGHFSRRTRRISIWRGRAPRSTASIRRPAAPIRCATSSN